MGAYEIIYADFPWQYTSFGTAKLPYDAMSEQEIGNFRWDAWMSKKCVVFSWATGPKLEVAFNCAKMWQRRYGLHYQGIAFVWVKTRKDGTVIGASGPRPRLVKQLAEYVLAFSTTPARRTFPLLTESMNQYVFAPKSNTHSRKPLDVPYRIVELLGDRPRVELFARDIKPGWDAWGDALGPGIHRSSENDK